uniref:Uncharacterized protein n=1 Tax=Anguilla anguilla TaxID=7936 RepID=A0A0E9XHW0_ANGAN
MSFPFDSNKIFKMFNLVIDIMLEIHTGSPLHCKTKMESVIPYYLLLIKEEYLNSYPAFKMFSQCYWNVLSVSYHCHYMAATL